MADEKQTMTTEAHPTLEAFGPTPDQPITETVTPTQESMTLPDSADNVIPFGAAGTDLPGADEEDTREPWEKTQAELDAENQKPKRGRPSKEEKAAQTGPEGEKVPEAAKPRKGRPPKADKAPPDEAPPPQPEKPPRGKKTVEKTAPAKESAPTPAPEEPSIPRDATRSEEPEQIVYLNLSELHAFKNHPFGVRDDAEMRALVESVRTGGVDQPAIVRPREDGGYEIIAGHRRQKASELAGYANMPCIVRNMSDDEAVLAMTDSNLRQRSGLLPSEKAQSLKMQVEAIKHQGARDTSGQDVQNDVGKRSIEIVGEKNSINYKQVQRYIRLTELVPDLLNMVDEKKLSFTPAVEISFIKPKNQRFIAVSIEGQQSAPSLSQAQRLRELDKEGKLNGDVIDGILSQEKKEVDKVIISTAELGEFFGKTATPREMKDKIMALLAEDKSKQPPELTKPEKKADLEK